jgi:hypothetical protein
MGQSVDFNVVKPRLETAQNTARVLAREQLVEGLSVEKPSRRVEETQAPEKPKTETTAEDGKKTETAPQPKTVQADLPVTAEEAITALKATLAEVKSLRTLLGKPTPAFREVLEDLTKLDAVFAKNQRFLAAESLVARAAKCGTAKNESADAECPVCKKTVSALPNQKGDYFLAVHDGDGGKCPASGTVAKNVLATAESKKPAKTEAGSYGNVLLAFDDLKSAQGALGKITGYIKTRPEALSDYSGEVIKADTPQAKSAGAAGLPGNFFVYFRGDAGNEAELRKQIASDTSIKVLSTDPAAILTNSVKTLGGKPMVEWTAAEKSAILDAAKRCTEHKDEKVRKMASGLVTVLS